MTLDQAEGRLCGYWRRTRDWAGCYGVWRPTQCVAGNVERINGGGASSVSAVCLAFNIFGDGLRDYLGSL